MQYNSPLERYWFEKDYKNFNIQLKKFIGYVCRMYFKGFKQTSERYNDLYSSIMSAIYNFLNSGHYEKTLQKIKLFRVLDKTEKWDKFEKMFNVKFENNSEKKKFIKHFDFIALPLKKLLKKLKISLDIEVKPVDFRSYIRTQISGELTKYFNKYNRERKFLSIHECTNVKKEDKLNELNHVHLIEDIIRRYNLHITVSDFFHNIENNEYENIYELKLISWVLFTNKFNDGELDEKFTF